MALYHKVVRPFHGAGHDRKPGEAVNVDDWPHGRKLIDQRMLSSGPAPESETVACGCGRRWFGQPADHGCTAAEKKPAAAGRGAR